MTNRFETTSGSRSVKSFRNCPNDPQSVWTSCLYVNNGETITTKRGVHSTEAGARKWAAKTLSAA